jgi:hypothetical protein
VDKDLCCKWMLVHAQCCSELFWRNRLSLNSRLLLQGLSQVTNMQNGSSDLGAVPGTGWRAPFECLRRSSHLERQTARDYLSHCCDCQSVVLILPTWLEHGRDPVMDVIVCHPC